MFKPELYQKSNSDTKRDALECLQKFASKIKWKEGDRVIDIGCGDGGLTVEVLRWFAGDSVSRLVGADVSAEMVAHAHRQHADRTTDFLCLDIGGDIPLNLVEAFDHVFSFYTLHWIQNQEVAFSNIYKLLTAGGQCLLLFVRYAPIQDVYRALAKHPRWQPWLTDAEKYISPYRDVEDPDKRVRGIMAKVGFSNIVVELEEKEYVYDLQHYRNTMEAICPFKIPAECMENFMDDYIAVIRGKQMIHQVDGKSIVKSRYSLLEAFGSKD